MQNLIYKEFRLATLPLTFIFLAFSLMTFIPGYPILCGPFFICLGIFQSYQRNREDSDILYSVVLPVKKTDVVKAKYLAAVILQMIAFVLSAAFTGIRMSFLFDSPVYEANVMMAANPVFLAFVLIIFAAFNAVFIGGFFKTAYATGKPFVIFIIVNFLIIGAAETLHHLPGLEWLNALDFSFAGPQLIVLLMAIIVYAAATTAACRTAQRSFEKINL